MKNVNSVLTFRVNTALEPARLAVEDFFANEPDASITLGGEAIGIMGKLLQFLAIVLMLVGAVILVQQPAYGYTDPGTGLLAIQAAGSALVAAGWYLRRRIYALLKRQPEAQVAPEAYSSASDDEGATLP